MTPNSVFFFIAGVMATVAVLIVLYPWLSGQPRATLWGALPRWAPIVGLAAVGAVLGLYLKLGSPQLNAQDAAPASASSGSGMGDAPAAAGASTAAAPKQAAGSMDSAVAGLERRLAAGGGTDGDWELLAKSYEFLGRPTDAAAARQKHLPAGAGTAAAGTAGVGAPPAPVKMSAEATRLMAVADAAREKRDFAAARDAYVKLVARKEMTADTWADYADVAAALNGNSLVGQPASFLAYALRLNPQHPKALWLLASLEHATHQYTAAVGTWQKLAAVLGPNAGDAKLIAANLAEDQRLAAGTAGAAAGGAPMAGAAAEGMAPPAAAAAGVAVRGEVVLADALQGKVPAGLTLFIVAKSVNSPGPPVAIYRTTTGRWPVRFQLDDSQSMIPSRTLSTAGPITIEARTSKTGQAMPAPGDFQGVTPQLDPASGKAVRIVIQRVIG